MKEVAKLQIKDRMELFQATAISMGMQPNVIEKDFWVCFMLDHLFHDCKYKNAFVFKGGTSLSKSYHVIERFSEDIDLILDWRKIMNDEVNPWEERSKTKQDLFNKQINSEAANFPEGKPLPARYARHLYDVYNMGNSWVKERAFKRKELLEKDVVFKQKFYYVKGAHYETATLSSIELLPKEAVLNALKEDYQAMRNMIYGNIPEFEEILEFLEKLQEEVHGLVVT